MTTPVQDFTMMIASYNYHGTIVWSSIYSNILIELYTTYWRQLPTINTYNIMARGRGWLQQSLPKVLLSTRCQVIYNMKRFSSLVKDKIIHVFPNKPHKKTKQLSEIWPIRGMVKNSAYFRPFINHLHAIQ